MEANEHTDIPNELDLLEFFHAEPVESSPIDGFWCYERSTGKERLLRISFNIFEKSVQTNLFIDGREIEVVSHEGAKRIYIAHENGTKILRCEFEILQTKTLLSVVFEPDMHLQWETLKSF